MEDWCLPQGLIKMTEENNLEILCRKHAYVPYQDKAYTKEASTIIENLNSSYSAYTQTNNEKKDGELKASLDSLGELNGSSKIGSLFQTETSYEKIKELGEKLVSKKDTLKKIKQDVFDRYNKEAGLIYTLSNSLRALSELKNKYEGSLKSLSAEIEIIVVERADEKGFEEYINGLMEEKASSENIQLNQKQRQKLRAMMIDEADISMKALCTDYLQLKNDILVIDNNTSSYSSLAEGREGPLMVLREFVKDMSKQIASFENVLTFYQVYTKDELEYLGKATFPAKFVDAVNRLSDHIDRVDKDSCRKALESLFSKKKILVKVPSIDVVVGGVIQAVEEEEAKKRKDVIVVNGEPIKTDEEGSK